MRVKLKVIQIKFLRIFLSCGNPQCESTLFPNKICQSECSEAPLLHIQVLSEAKDINKVLLYLEDDSVESVFNLNKRKEVFFLRAK